jgi:hypothetical protein
MLYVLLHKDVKERRSKIINFAFLDFQIFQKRFSIKNNFIEKF